jgi:hypothetical protein
MDYKRIFNGDLKDWYLITKQTNTPELIAISKSAISAGYRLFKRGGKIYHCFESGGVVGCIPTGAKDGDDFPIYPMRPTDRYFNEEIFISLCIER